MRNAVRAMTVVGATTLVLGALGLGCGEPPTTSTGQSGAGGVAGASGAAGDGGASGSAGQGGAGGSSGCADGEMKPCYSGPAGTENSGSCKAGTATCAGGQWSACVGEVLPSTESCNGVDDDCNGQTDDGFPSMTCGQGACQVMVEGCVGGMVPTCQPGNPLPETCDGTDEDCDGEIDNGINCPCSVEGETRSCYSGSMSTIGVGECKAGLQTCVAGAWGNCEGEVLPSAEVCDNLDDDCDGQADENLGTTTCGAGACLTTVVACINGVPQTCTPEQPTVESCNGIDDDCNLFIDDGIGMLTCGVGACQVMVPACAGGQMQTCTPGAPTSEVCDGIDNNCNGTADESNPGGGGACMTGQAGVCGAGVTTCVGGALQCAPTMTASAETCDNKDNDCDGQTDEGNPGGGNPCMTGQLGACAAGTTTCNGGSIACTQNMQSSPEVCDGLDNNCNGATDEGNPGSGSACTVPGKQGPCAQGVQQCQNGALTCQQTIFPTTETCNGIDDNCNGAVDEGNPESGGGCSTPLPGVCSSGTYQCQGGGLVCVQTGQASAEICDNKDNDCDGLVDENNPGGGQTCNTGALGVCAVGSTACSLGTIVCNQTTTPSTETCDGLDNNCNGAVDEGNPGAGQACSTGNLGACSAGTRACMGGTLVCVQNQQPSTEMCDGIDNDCDGLVDENNPGAGGSCTTGLPGVCGSGTYQCQGGSLVCVSTTMPQAEICDGVDNDCNGVVDNGNPGGGAACSTGLPAPCANGTVTCTNGALACGGTVTVFEETFANATAGNGWNGWTLGTEWQIGTAMASTGHDSGFGDPAQDHTLTADNKLAWVVIGGNASILSTHPMYYLTSPTIDASAAGNIMLDFWRWLNTDYYEWMSNSIEVYDGSTWVVVWQKPASTSDPNIVDSAWTNITHDLTAHKNANMRIRFGFEIGLVDTASWIMSSWNIDDVVVRRCP